MNLNKEHGNEGVLEGIFETFSKIRYALNKEEEKECFLSFDSSFCAQEFVEKPIYNAGEVLLEKYSSIIRQYPVKKEKRLFFLKRSLFSGIKKDVSEEYWGRVSQFLDIESVISKQTYDIIEECLHYIEPIPVAEKRQQIHSLPQLCSYHKLTSDEIKMLCYILYDSKNSMSDDFFTSQSTMATARYLCKERRYVLRLNANRYGRMLQQILLVDTRIGISDIITWMNAMSRIYHLITTLLCFKTNEESIFLALYNIPRKVLCSAAEGCIVDKTIVNRLKLTKPKDLKKVQEIIIISEVTKIIKHKMQDEKIFDPRILLETVDPKEYMRTMNPVFSLLQKFKNIDQVAPSLIRIPDSCLQYIMDETKPLEYTQEYFENINYIAYSAKRIIAHKKIENPESKEGYEIIKYLLSLSEELVVFYGIHPQEYEKKNSNYHTALLPSLAYIQYNKEHQVYTHALSLMKYIPLELYINEEEAHEVIQKHYENIIENYPMLLTFPERKLLKLLRMRAEYLSEDSGLYQLFEDVENIIEVLKRISVITNDSFLSEEEYMQYLSSISIDKVKYISSFPEIAGSPFFKKLPIDLLNNVYNSLLQERRMCGGKYDTILIQHISPLEILPVEYNDILIVQHEELLYILRNKLETVIDLFEEKEYERSDLCITLNTVKSCYYSNPLSEDTYRLLLEHSQLVLEVYYAKEESNLRELCKKPKNILEKYRKEEESKKNIVS